MAARRHYCIIVTWGRCGVAADLQLWLECVLHCPRASFPGQIGRQLRECQRTVLAIKAVACCRALRWAAAVSGRGGSALVAICLLPRLLLLRRNGRCDVFRLRWGSFCGFEVNFMIGGVLCWVGRKAFSFKKYAVVAWVIVRATFVVVFVSICFWGNFFRLWVNCSDRRRVVLN